MEIQPIRGSGELSTKANMTKFVHHVADMEVRAFTMRETAQKCRKEMKKKKKELEEKCARWKNVRDGKQKAYNASQIKVDGTTFRDYRRQERTSGLVALHVFMHILLMDFSIAIVIAPGIENGLPIFLIVFLAVASPLTYLFLFYKIHFACMRKQYAKYIEDLKKVRDDAKQQYNDAEKTLKEADQELADAVEQEKQVELMARRLEQDADRITENLKRCYELGVIMPSYRNLVSVVILDDIFTNDKADTMREAILLCDTEIRHAELIGKLDEVVHALKVLASAIQSMANILQSINTNVSLISQDVYRMAETQEEIKYAADAIKSSADNADFYIAQRRAGAL